MWLFTIIGAGLVALAHVAPARFLLDAMADDRAVWNMPRTQPSTVYLTYDDGPNPTTTPDLLDVLAGERDGRSDRTTRGLAPVPHVPPSRGMARRPDAPGAQGNRLSAGGMGLDAVGLQLDASPRGLAFGTIC